MRNTEEGPVTPIPCGRPRACGEPYHHPTSGTRSKAFSGEGCCPTTITHGGASGNEEPKTEASRRAPFWVSRRTMRIVLSCEALLFPDTLSCFSTNRRAHEPSFTATKAVKRGARTSVGASSRPHTTQETAQETVKEAHAAPAVSAEAVSMSPMSLMEAIPVSCGDETEARDVAPTMASPTFSDLLCVIPDTLDVAGSSGAGGCRRGWSLGATLGVVRGVHHPAFYLRVWR